MAGGRFRTTAGLGRSMVMTHTGGASLSLLIMFALGWFLLPIALGKPQAIISEEAANEVEGKTPKSAAREMRTFHAFSQSTNSGSSSGHVFDMSQSTDSNNKKKIE